MIPIVFSINYSTVKNKIKQKQKVETICLQINTKNNN